MLETIQTLEAKLAADIAAAKHAAASAVQTARTKAADGRKELEERLRADEHMALAQAEAEATREAARLIEAAKQAVAPTNHEKVDALARALVKPYVG